MSLLVVVEGDTDLPVIRALARDAGLEISAEIDCSGKARLDQELRHYNAAAKGSPWLVLRDLDEDAACAVDLRMELGLRWSRWMCFRIAVREMESWLMADSQAMAGFLSVNRAWIPIDPDAEKDPTRTLVSLAKRSRKRDLQRAMVPRAGQSVAVGPAYEAKLIEFATNHWELDRACLQSASLRRARAAIKELGAHWRQYCAKGSRPVEHGVA